MYIYKYMSTHKQKFFRRHGVKEDSLSLTEISKLSGVSLNDLLKVQDRGEGAWSSNIKSVRLKSSFKKNNTAPRSARLSADQWGRARVYAFVNKLDEIKEGKRKEMNQDTDIYEKYIKK